MNRYTALLTGAMLAATTTLSTPTTAHADATINPTDPLVIDITHTCPAGEHIVVAFKIGDIGFARFTSSPDAAAFSIGLSEFASRAPGWSGSMIINCSATVIVECYDFAFSTTETPTIAVLQPGPCPQGPEGGEPTPGLPRTGIARTTSLFAAVSLLLGLGLVAATHTRRRRQI